MRKEKILEGSGRAELLMYNEVQKLEYISIDKKNEDTLRNYFKRISPKEREYGKDISLMDIDELKSTINFLEIRRDDTRGQLISLLRGYCKWAKIVGYANDSSAIESITPENTSSQVVIRSQLLKDPNQLSLILGNMYDTKNYPNRSARDMLICWLLYCGIKVNELVLLRKDSINYLGNIVTTNEGKQIKINDEIAEYWNTWSNATCLERKNGKTSDKKNNEYSKQDLYDTPMLLRTVNAHSDTRALQNVVFIVVKKINNTYNKGKDPDKNIKIPPANIYYSGVFYRLYEKEISGDEITSEVIADHFNIDYKNNMELSTKTRKWRIDYEDWKLAFGYM